MAEMLVPVEMMGEILARLPVRSILRLRSVCKTWRDIIDNDVSVTLHLDGDIALGKKLPTCFFIRPHRYADVRDLEMYLVEKQQQEEEEDVVMFKATKLNFPQATRVDDVNFVLAARGLCTVCYYAPVPGVPEEERRDFYRDFICNPFSGQFLQLPPILAHECEKGIITGGFGYHPSTGEFKVIRTFFYRDTMETDFLAFTLGSNSWKKLENYPRGERLESHSVSIDTVLHWFSKDVGLLLTFDIVSETFGYMQLPVPRLSPYPGFLGNLNGCLSMADGYINDYTDIWVMKDYGVADSWTKLVLFRGSIRNDDYLLNFIPILLLNETEILLIRQRTTLVVHNFETGITTPLHLDGVPENTSFEAYPYCGNLLSFQPADWKTQSSTDDTCSAG